MSTSRSGDGRRAGGDGRDARRTTREDAPQISIDDTARQIIRQLQADGRRAYATIGKAVGLSEAAVRQRVQRLLGAGIIRIVAVTDPLRLGSPRRAMVGVRATGDLETVADRLAALAEVDSVVITAGSFDLLAEVGCRDDEHLLRTLCDLRTVDGVLSTEPFVYLRSVAEPAGTPPRP